MKKTLIITLEFPPTIGGIATYVEDLAEGLDPEQIIVLAPEHKDALASDGDRPYTIIRKKVLLPRILWPRWIKLYFIAARIVKEYQVERILIHHVLPVGYIGILLKKRKKIPYLLFSHGTDLVAGTATAWKRKMVRWVSSHADQLIFNSESLKSRFLQVLPEFEKKTEVVYPCPDPGLLNPVSPEIVSTLRSQLALEGRTVMLSVGRITDGKGFTHIARLLPQLAQRIPHLAWVVVGDGPKHDEVVALVQKAGLQSIVRFVGAVQPTDLSQYYHLADFFVVLTHPDEGREEGLGLVFLEASAAGLPIVAGESGGVSEAVLHTQTGLVVDLYKGDAVVLDAITQVATNSSFSKSLAQAAKERIASSFIWEHQLAPIKKWLS